MTHPQKEANAYQVKQLIAPPWKSLRQPRHDMRIEKAVNLQ